jgi:hypothetical protein
MGTGAFLAQITLSQSSISMVLDFAIVAVANSKVVAKSPNTTTVEPEI